MNPVADRPVRFDKLTIKDVERLVGRNADSVEVRKKWVTCFFGGRPGTDQAPAIADVSVSFKRW